MTRTKENQTSRKSRNDCRITAFLHDSVYDGYRHTSKHRWERPHADIGNVVLRVAVTNGFELEFAVEANKPTGKTVEHFRERWMDIEVVFSLDVV